MKRLIDTNVLVYRFDPRHAGKQEIADEVLRRGLATGELVLPHQAVIEFVAAVIRPRTDLGGVPLLSPRDALLEAEGLMRSYSVLYPEVGVLTTALRSAPALGLSWFDAHLWAYAEVNGIPEILSEDFEHGRHYGSVRVVDPFLAAADEVHELPAMFDRGAPGSSP